MFIKRYGSAYIPHDFSGDLPIHAWHNYGPQYQPWKKSNEGVNTNAYKFFCQEIALKLTAVGHIHSYLGD